MKMKRSQLERIVKEELAGYLGGLLREKEGEVPDLADAEKEGEADDAKKPSDKKMKPQMDPDNTAGKPKGKKDMAPDAEPPEQDNPEDSADKDLEKQAAGDDEEEAGPEDTEKVSDELVGQTIQSITANPKSKMMPGALEIVFQFQQKPEPLKILVTKSGKVVYVYKGVHNEI